MSPRPTEEAIVFENRKRTWKLLSIIFAILVLVVIVVCIVELPKTAKLNVLVAPIDARVSVGGKSFKNGEHRIEPGTYDVVVTREGFGSYEGKVELKDGKTTKLYLCLTKDEGNDEYYAAHQNDYKVCYSVQEYEAERLDQAKTNSDPIFKVAPYHSYDKGFYIDPYFDESNKVRIKIKLITCNKERADGLKENALDWLRARGVDLDKYEIEYSSCGYGNQD